MSSLIGEEQVTALDSNRVRQQGSVRPAPARHAEPVTSPHVTVRQFDAFYRSEYRGVLAIMAGLVRNRAVAEELTQDAFLRAHSRWSTVSSHPNPEAWIRRVAINLSMSWLRRRRAEARSLLRLKPQALLVELPESSADWWAAVRALPMRQAQCVLLHYVEDMAVKDIAGVLVLAEGTVKTHLFLARKALAESLNLEDGEST